MNKTLLSVAGAAALAGCIVEAPGGTPQRSGVQEQARQAAAQVPPLNVKSGANLDNKVELVGATFLPGAFLPGEQVRASVYFKVLDAIPADYIVFVHVEDVDGRMERLNVDHHPGGGMNKTSQWKKGETVRDDFAIYIPPGSGARAINIYLGLWQPDTDQRMKLLNPEAVRNDGNSRILLAQVPVAG